jgi:hypothetical protein
MASDQISPFGGSARFNFRHHPRALHSSRDSRRKIICLWVGETTNFGLPNSSTQLRGHAGVGICGGTPMDFIGTGCARRAQLKKLCVKQNSSDRNSVPPLMEKKRQEECGPYLQVALYSRPKAFHSLFGMMFDNPKQRAADQVRKRTQNPGEETGQWSENTLQN